jgi:hypothetical protein
MTSNMQRQFYYARKKNQPVKNHKADEPVLHPGGGKFFSIQSYKSPQLLI